MQIKMEKLFTTFILLLSLQGYSQTIEKSKHPLLDKYYPRAKVDTAATVITAPNPVPAKPIVPIAVPENKPIPVVNSLPETKLTSEIITVHPVTDTTVINKPTNIVVALPVQKTIQPRPAAPVDIRARLGSSTPAYDTWEKNSNGAGSVTTSPK